MYSVRFSAGKYVRLEGKGGGRTKVAEGGNYRRSLLEVFLFYPDGYDCKDLTDCQGLYAAFITTQKS